jgi:hypothetical protein
MIAARNDRTIRDVEQCVAIGSLMTPTNDVSLEIQRRIQTANRCFLGLRKRNHLRSSHISRHTKFTIHKTLIRPVARRMVSTGGGTTTNSIKSLTVRMALVSLRQADCATLVT